MMKAAAPMTGGMICPPVPAAASTPAAKTGLYPTLFMRGIVKEPTVTALATEEPLMEPMKPLAMTATLAGPPDDQPARAMAMSMKSCARPVRAMKRPKSTKWKTKVATTPSGMP